MPSPFQAAHDSDPASASKDPGIDPLLETCLEQTLQAFSAAGIATEIELARTQSSFRKAAARGEPADLLETLAKAQGIEEEYMGIEASRIAHVVAGVIHPSPAIIPFAGKLIAPSAFYESFDQLHRTARNLLSPILYAEDADCIGVGALNPIAARLMAGEILASVDHRFGIKPFVTAVRLDYETWTFLCRKHFGL